MTDVHIGGVFIGAGMSDDLSIGGGVRVTAPADLWLCGLIGMEEKLGSAYADGALVELYRLAFEREYATEGVHVAGAAVFSGTVHATMATGFRQLFKVARGVRDLTPEGSAEGGNAPAPPAAPPPVEEAGASGALLGPSAVGLDEVDELAALEDIRYLFGDLDTTVDRGRAGNRAGVLDDLGSVAKFSATGEDVGDARALANRLQEGAGLSDLVEAQDMSAILHLDESPGTLDEARMVPDERLDGQWDNTNWVERGYIVPVEPEVRYEHLLGMDNPPERMDIGQHGAAPGIPEDFDFDRASHYFNWRCDIVGTDRGVRLRVDTGHHRAARCVSLGSSWPGTREPCSRSPNSPGRLGKSPCCSRSTENGMLLSRRRAGVCSKETPRSSAKPWPRHSTHEACIRCQAD